MGEFIQKSTMFFREPSALTTIVKKLAPQFGSKCKIASVGCSSGEEVYSLLFLNQLSSTGVELWVDGYDYNPEVLEASRRGAYQLSEIGGHFYSYRSALLFKLTGGLPKSAEYFTMPEAIRKKASFNEHDISKVALLSKYPIILCANVLYHYFNQSRVSLVSVLDNLADSLENNGYLVCEATNHYEGNNAAEYSEALESHGAFRKRYELGVVFTHRVKSYEGLVSVEQARVFQKAA